MQASLIKQKNSYLGSAIFLAENCYRGYPPLYRMKSPVEKIYVVI